MGKVRVPEAKAALSGVIDLLNSCPVVVTHYTDTYE